MTLSLRSGEIFLDIKISFNLMNIDFACAMRISISLLLLPSLVIVWPRYLNCCTCSSCFQSTLIFACISSFVLINILFVTMHLVVFKKFEHIVKEKKMCLIQL